MNKLLMVAVCMTLSFFSCMDTSFEESSLSSREVHKEYFDGTIYEYLKEENTNLKFDSLLYLLDMAEQENMTDVFGNALSLKKISDALKDENAEYTLMAVPDTCFVLALQGLNDYRKLEKLKLTEEDLDSEATDLEKNAIGNLSLKKIWNYQLVVSDEDANGSSVETYYDYKSKLDEIVCMYVIPGVYDTDRLSTVTTVEGEFVQAINAYRMAFLYKRLPASGFVNGGTKELTFYDMCNTLEQSQWRMTKALYTDVYAKNGVIHVVIPQHEFGFEKFVEYFGRLGHEKEQ